MVVMTAQGAEPLTLPGGSDNGRASGRSGLGVLPGGRTRGGRCRGDCRGGGGLVGAGVARDADQYTDEETDQGRARMGEGASSGVHGT